MFQRNRQNSKSELVYFILTSLLKNTSWCPTRHEIDLNDDLVSILIQTADNNKLVVLLRHFLECKNCKKHLSSDLKKEIARLQKASITLTLIISKAQEKILGVLRSAKVDFCLVKNWSLYPMLYKKFPRTRSDLDILISIMDKSKVIRLLSQLGFSKYDHFQMKSGESKNVYYEEYVVRNKKNLVKVDLRFLVAMPNAEKYALFLPKDTETLSREVINYENTIKKSLPIEIFLLIHIMHFFSNDLMRGLRHLYEISYLAKLYRNKIDWNQFDRLVRKYNARLVTMFVFFLAKSVFGFSLEYPKDATISERLSVKLSRLVLSPESIVFFPKLEIWGDDVVAIGRENMLLRLFLQPKLLFHKIYQLKEKDTRTIFFEKVVSSL